MANLKGVHHISLHPNAEIYDKTVAFYTDIIGCTPVMAWGEGNRRCCFLSCGDNTVMEIGVGEDDGTRHDGKIAHIAFQVEDVDTLAEAIAAAGYEIAMGPKDVTLTETYKARIAFYVGPVGEYVELFKVY